MTYKKKNHSTTIVYLKSIFPYFIDNLNCKNVFLFIGDFIYIGYKTYQYYFYIGTQVFFGVSSDAKCD